MQVRNKFVLKAYPFYHRIHILDPCLGCTLAFHKNKSLLGIVIKCRFLGFAKILYFLHWPADLNSTLNSGTGTSNRRVNLKVVHLCPFVIHTLVPRPPASVLLMLEKE